jgi:hypothetical protein
MSAPPTTKPESPDPDVREGYCGACHDWTAHPSHCHCGAPFNEAGGDWRFDGYNWQHYHGYPIGHVVVEICTKPSSPA